MCFTDDHVPSMSCLLQWHQVIYKINFLFNRFVHMFGYTNERKKEMKKHNKNSQLRGVNLLEKKINRINQNTINAILCGL